LTAGKNAGQVWSSEAQPPNDSLQQIIGDSGADVTGTENPRDAILVVLGTNRPVSKIPPVRNGPGPSATQDHVFICYSHKDKKWLEMLKTMLQPLLREGKLKLWDDTRIRSGAHWQAETALALATARVAVLLVSDNFLASDFIAKHELPPLLLAAKQGGLTILWVPVSASMYKETEIERFQAAHDPARPLESLKGHARKQALLEIAQRIKEASQALLETAQQIKEASGALLETAQHSKEARRSCSPSCRVIVSAGGVLGDAGARGTKGGTDWVRWHIGGPSGCPVAARDSDSRQLGRDGGGKTGAAGGHRGHSAPVWLF
jgi:hypothetical protein